MCRRIAGCFLFFLMLGAAGLAWLYYDVTRAEPRGAASSAPTGSRTAPPTAAERQSAQRAAERIERQARGSRRSAAPRTRGGDPGSFEVRVTEQEVNDMVRSLPQVRETLEQQRISAPTIHFEPDRLVISGRVPVLAGMEARVSAGGRVWAQDGHLAYETTDVHVGSLPAPKALRTELDRHIAQAVRSLNGRIEGRIDSVEITDDALVVRGARRPRRPS